MNKQTTIIIIVFALSAGFILGRVTLPHITFASSESINGHQEYTVANCISVLDENNVQKTSKGWVKWFVPKSFSQGLNLKMSQVAGHQARHGAHSHPGEEIFFVLKGQAEFTVGDEHQVVGPNTSLYCPPGVLHGIRNAGDSALRYLVIKVD